MRQVTDILSQLVADEEKKASAYQDNLGYWTIGVGTCIDVRKGCGLTDAEIYLLLNNRLNQINQLIEETWPWTTGLDGVRLGVLQNMAYQMGISGLGQFKLFLASVQQGDYTQASEEMLDSLWAKSQSPARAERLSIQMREGTWQ